jgi:hypothetical protein
MEAEPAKANPPKGKRRWFQFSLRSLMIGVTLLAVVCGYVARVACLDSCGGGCQVGSLHQERRQEAREHDPVERPGAADREHTDRNSRDVAQMEEIGADQRPEHAGHERDRRSIGQHISSAQEQPTHADGYQGGCEAGEQDPDPGYWPSQLIADGSLPSLLAEAFGF